MPKNLFRLFYCFCLIVTGFLANALPARACSVCGCGDPLASAGTNIPMSGIFHLGFEWDYLTASALADTNNVAIESLIQRTLNITLSYNPSSDLTLIAQIPIVNKQWWTTAFPAPPPNGYGVMSAYNTGLGDINIGLRYFFWKDIDLDHQQSWALAFSSSLYLPTGNSTNPNVPDPHAELGTGAFGASEGLLLTHYAGPFNLSANVTAVIRSVNNTGIYAGYQFANAIRWGIQGQYNVADPLALSLSLDGRYAEQDSFAQDEGLVPNGDLVPNTGGLLWDLTPGVNWAAFDGVGLYAKVQIPVATYLTGDQTTGPVYSVGTQFTFR
jgi:hypothetical protein